MGNTQTFGGKQPIERKLDLSASSTFSPSKQKVSLKNDLLKTFMDQVFLERELESLKLSFNQVQEFSLQAAFKIFDVENRGYLTEQNLREVTKDLIADGLVASKLNSTLEDVRLIVKRYDQDSDGRLSYEDFQKLLLPRD